MEWFKKVVDGITSIPDLILDGIKEIFVPDDDYLSDKVDDIRSQFQFADSVIQTVESLQNRMSLASRGISAPTVILHLSANESHYGFSYGGNVQILDMSWFSRYKSTTDLVISGIMWSVFVWQVFVRLPGIISGVSSVTGNLERIEDFVQSESKKGVRRKW